VVVSIVGGETGVPGENHWPVTDKLYHKMLYTSPWSRFELTTSVVIGTDCKGICKPTTIRPRRPFNHRCRRIFWGENSGYRKYVNVFVYIVHI